MNILPAKTLRRPQSLAWIGPSGEILPLDGDEMHSDLAETFPGIPSDAPYPTNYALNHLGYLKVGNAFDFAYKRANPPENVDRPRQLDAMAQIVAQAAINFITKGLPVWFLPSRGVLDDPEKWPVYRGDSEDGSMDQMRTKRFIETYGSDDTKIWFDNQLRRAEEAMIRKQVRMILSELRRGPV